MGESILPAAAVPAGDLPGWSSAYPAFGLLSCPLSPPPALAERSSPVGKGETKVIFMQGASPLASPGAGRDAALKVVGRGVRRGLAPGGTGRSIRVLQTRQKRLSRFCNTRHSSRHAGAQEKAGTGHERRIPSIIICSEKFWGVWGTLSRVPQRFPSPPRASMRKSKRRRRFFFADCRQAGENVL